MRRLLLAIILLLTHNVCYCQNIAEIYMNNPYAAFNDANTAYCNGDYSKAIKLVKIYNSLSDKQDGKELLLKAQQCQQYVEAVKIFESQGDYSSVKQYYENILKINPEDPNAKTKVSSFSFDEIRDYNLGIACVRKGNKWGAIDEEKKIIIPIVYDAIRDFWPFNPKQITTTAVKNGKMGFVNKYGKEVTPFIYSSIRGIELDTPNIYFMVYKPNSPEVYVDMDGVEYPTEDEAAYGILGLPKTNNITKGPYHIGDFYHENGTKGIVFEIDERGYSGKVVSLVQGYTDWALENTEYLNKQIGLWDDIDGESNFRKVKLIKNWSTYFPGFKWCSNLGNGWYLPAKYELKSINDNIKMIDKGLKYAGYRPMNQANYMSSTEINGTGDRIYYMWGLGGKPGKLEAAGKSGNWVVAVKKFGSSFGNTKDDVKIPPRKPSTTILSLNKSIYCDGVYHGPGWEYDYKQSGLYEHLGNSFNRNYFSISFDFYIVPSEDGYKRYSKNNNIFTIDTGTRAFGLTLEGGEHIFAETNNCDNFFDTMVSFQCEQWQHIELVYDNGTLIINGNKITIGPLNKLSNNIISSVHFGSGRCFKGYIKNFIVKSN